MKIFSTHPALYHYHSLIIMKVFFLVLVGLYEPASDSLDFHITSTWLLLLGNFQLRDYHSFLHSYHIRYPNVGHYLVNKQRAKLMYFKGCHGFLKEMQRRKNTSYIFRFLDLIQ